ncbi:hypothetical protein [Flagellimonas onchidii]|uniref:hypothetical protein n=1 Tax=Flagellimonas onchidii TaxID=2562684 RepID=UPI0010A62A50|nr:hypothetical protein [Allomuricauda onchidii]
MAHKSFFEIKIIGNRSKTSENHIYREVTSTEENAYKIFDRIDRAYILTRWIKKYQIANILLQYATVTGGKIYYTTWEKKEFKIL